ncbi:MULTISPECIES: VOC family protein [Catenuloplanes]|uniref:Glyoxalase-like domain-containing protein n=1 Tax=Catenuloplanes niger TaxID=587534 RepID=A0AAE3ZKG6_9ACTN|nr:VOC family protein [Catenuloplanes niger]MDR7320881.1 hypothetical protein [Catenuloplanes niger]
MRAARRFTVERTSPPGGTGSRLVDDLDAAETAEATEATEAAAIVIGATGPAEQPGTSYRVLLDPAGRPFCLCPD